MKHSIFAHIRDSCNILCVLMICVHPWQTRYSQFSSLATVSRWRNTVCFTTAIQWLKLYNTIFIQLTKKLPYELLVQNFAALSNLEAEKLLHGFFPWHLKHLHNTLSIVLHCLGSKNFPKLGQVITIKLKQCQFQRSTPPGPRLGGRN